MSATSDPFPAFYQALEARHRAELTFAEVRRALQALSSLYVERRGRIARGDALAGRGKRAAFALYYGPLHFLLVREVVRALGPSLGGSPVASSPGASSGAPPGASSGASPGAPRRVLDIGCGTGAAGAAWALECTPVATVQGIDRSGWAVAETRFTLQRLGLAGAAARGDACAPVPPDPRRGLVVAFTANELGDGERERLLARLLQAGEGGAPVLVVEPISRRVAPWWPTWTQAFLARRGREDEWRVRPPLPPALALLGRAAGLDTRELTGRSLALPAAG